MKAIANKKTPKATTFIGMPIKVVTPPLFNMSFRSVRKIKIPSALCKSIIIRPTKTGKIEKSNCKKLADGISGNCKYINKNESVDKMAICANLRVLVIVSSIKKFLQFSQIERRRSSILL